MKRAVFYLRVSTTGQVETDYDPEGLSIPAQRVACARKAEQMGVTVVGEYVEPGRSATTIAKRPVFQQMMAELKHERTADYVIVYNLSRLNRNRVDDAYVLMAMRGMGVTLISAQENIDETPAGQLLHGILASFNEYRSSADGADIRYKMGQKAKNGGTLGKAPLGYLNVRDRYEGREVRTVAVDDARAPLVRVAFELYATGEYSLKSLALEMNLRGLRSRGDGRSPAQAVSVNKLNSMLRDRYYLGIVTYQGVDYPGRHERLVEPALFTAVQVVLNSRGPASERERRHNHYLKGLLWCAACREVGRESRMVIQRTVNKTGEEYWYFFCMGRQTRLCDAPYVPADVAERLVLRHYEGVALPDGFASQVSALLESTLADENRSGALLRAQLSERLSALAVQEENLLDLAADGSLPQDKIRQRLHALSDERERVSVSLTQASGGLTAGAVVLRLALDVVPDLSVLYRQSGEQGRRLINQAFFERLYITYTAVREERLRPQFDELLYLRRRPSYGRTRPLPRQTGARGGAGLAGNQAGSLATALAGGSSSKTVMVELRGFEPLAPSMRTRCATGLRHSPKRHGTIPRTAERAERGKSARLSAVSRPISRRPRGGAR